MYFKSPKRIRLELFYFIYLRFLINTSKLLNEIKLIITILASFLHPDSLSSLGSTGLSVGSSTGSSVGSSPGLSGLVGSSSFRTKVLFSSIIPEIKLLSMLIYKEL